MTPEQIANRPQQANPFTPVFGKIPAYMAGREHIISAMADAFDYAGSNPDLCSIFVGARGTGKTALLAYLSIEAQGYGWISANVTASEGMLEDIFQQLERAGSHLLDAPDKKRLSSVEVAHLGAVAWENQTEHLNWRSRMNLLFDQLAETDTGVLITVDEIDPSLPEMVQLVTTYQHFVGEGRKAALLMAGLPHRVSSLLSGKSTSFLRRAARHNLGSIPRYEVEEAFRLTVEDGGKTIDDEALAIATDAIDGFPFMFQLVGYRSWNAAHFSHALSVEHVRQGARLAQEELASRVFDATYSELSRADRAFVHAMAQDDAVSQRADIMARVGKSSSYVSAYKRRLLEAGVIEESSRGELKFALPGFRDYVRGIEENGLDF